MTHLVFARDSNWLETVKSQQCYLSRISVERVLIIICKNLHMFKGYYLVSLFSLILLAIGSCKKSDVSPTSKDVYYVKYVIKGNTTYSYFSDFSVNSDKGVKSFSGYQYRSWSQTYGPVKKGFNAHATVKGSLVSVEIYVSKDNGPFALKSSKTGSNMSSSISQSYTIDF